MGLPSRSLRKAAAQIIGERSYLAGVEKDLELAKEVSQFLESRAGAVLYSALEDLERSAYAGMTSTSPFRIFKQIEYRKELDVAQYLKGKMNAVVLNGEVLENNLESIYGEPDDTAA